MPTPSAEISNYAHLTHSFCFKCVDYDPELSVPLNLERSKRDSSATPGQHATLRNKLAWSAERIAWSGDVRPPKAHFEVQFLWISTKFCGIVVEFGATQYRGGGLEGYGGLGLRPTKESERTPRRWSAWSYAVMGLYLWRARDGVL